MGQTENRYERTKINANSNYRLYYEKDPAFYSAVIEKEEAPFEFKIHLFPKEGQSGQSPQGDELREEKIEMMSYLTENF